MDTPAPSPLVVDARALGARGAWTELRALLGARVEESRVHPELITLFGEALLRTQAPREARTWLAGTRTAVRRSGDRAAVRRSVNLEGVACFETGELAQAEERFHEALELGRQDGDDLLLARATNNLGTIANVRGAPTEALALYRLAVPAYQRLGHARGLAETYHNLAISYRDLGDVPHADESERRAAEFARQAADARLAAMALVGLAELRLRSGDAELAEAEARRGAGEMARIGDPKGEADALRLVGAAATRRGRFAEARTALERALTLARTQGFAVIEAEALRARAELAHAEGRRDASRDEAREALAIYERLGARREAQALHEWLEETARR
ncbi:MAG TPA: tetratricopeptide repeat protein [Gemmatimonadaceae bacterium]|nr:tetratricopeptide repeat protein [Gemmatimonadaceae bacterium]